MLVHIHIEIKNINRNNDKMQLLVSGPRTIQSIAWITLI